MVRPISLRLRNAEILAQARATLIRAGRGDELKRAHTARVVREGRRVLLRWRPTKRLLPSARLIGGRTKSMPLSLSERAGTQRENWF